MILAGFILVLLTWAVALVVVVGAGLLPASLVSPGCPIRVVLCRSMWWGLLTTVIASYAINLFQPLRSTPATLILLGLVVTSALAAFAVIRHGRNRGEGASYRSTRAESSESRGFRLALIGFRVTMIAAVIYLAVAVLGPVTNYDSGLYHLGAIKYASEYPTIPGLANIFPALGYGNAEFPLAALLGNSPLGESGYRALNGLIMLLLVVEILVRIHTRRFGAGFFVLAISVSAALVPMVALSDYWMTSPSQDSAVMLVTIAASAYFVDALSRPRSWVPVAATSMGLCILLVMLRPTMIVLTGVTLVVLVVIAVKRRSFLHDQRIVIPVVIVGSLSAFAVVAATARDYVLSGWFQYPLSLHAFKVDWLAPDPVSERLATLGYHRNPEDIWGSINGWAWVPSWMSRLPSQWETYEFLGLLLVGVIVLAASMRASGQVRLQGRLLALALLPSLSALSFWWVATPPSFRFTWGSLFAAPAILIGWVLARIFRENSKCSERVLRSRIFVLPTLALAIGAMGIAMTVAYSAAARLDLSAANEIHDLGPIKFAVTAPVNPSVAAGKTEGGLSVLRPIDGEQCWAVFPLCTPRLLETVAPRGNSLRDGFLP